jgi:secreted PhoX family phosphatase
MTSVSRRTLLRGGAAVAAGIAVAGPFEGFVAYAERGGARSDGYGPLVPIRDERDGLVRLELPRRFRYRTFHHAGETLHDGSVLPGRHDGMAAFRGRRGTTVLVRNHELNTNINDPRPANEPRLGDAPGYDPLAKGGTVTVHVDGRGRVLDSWVSLSGTQMNCVGGTTPWGTWLSCEETVNGDDVGADFTGASNAGLAKHGYIFEVPTRGVSSARPIRAAGRMSKEACVVDPHRNAIYITEDCFLAESGLYVFVPDRDPRRRGRLDDAGRLYMLGVRGLPRAPLHEGQPRGARYRTEWIRIEDPDPTFEAGVTNNDAIKRVGDEGRAKGAAIFSRLEGAIWSRDRLYFTSTEGGAPAPGLPLQPEGFGPGRGQVWSFDPARQRLELVYESTGDHDLDLPDNIAASANGTLLLCEDSPGDNFVRGLTRRGRLFDFVRNVDPAQVGQEFAGATFSADGDTLFLNIQSGPDVGRLGGYSVAIWGPWDRGPFGGDRDDD